MNRTPDFPAGDSPAPIPLPPTLAALGWTPARAATFAAPPPCEPGRVVAATRGLALVRTAAGETWSTPTGALRNRLFEEGRLPCAGDWAALRPDPGGGRALMVDLLPRGASLLRQGPAPGDGPQCLAANLDLVLLVMGLDRDLNPARMERLLALAWGSGARPLIVLTKRDLTGDPEAGVRRIAGVAPGVEVRAVSALTGEGLEGLRSCLAEGLTAVLAGASGAGKSTLLNALLGAEVNRTREVRESDGRGRHTTTLRQLFRLPGGGCLIDTPGIREVGLCAGSTDLEGAFADLEALASGCRFRDCTHGAEPGCRVREALAEGTLAPDRFARFLRLRREAAYQSARSDERLWREREARWKRIGKLQRQRDPRREG